MPKPCLKARAGFAFVELMILTAAIALVAMVAVTHFKHREPASWRGSMEFAGSSSLQYAVSNYVLAAAEK